MKLENIGNDELVNLLMERVKDLKGRKALHPLDAEVALNRAQVVLDELRNRLLTPAQ